MIPINWPDQTKAALTYLRGRPSLTGVTVTRSKRDGARRQVVLDVEPQQLETPLSRRFTILLESWVVDGNGHSDVGESYELMSTVLFELQAAASLLTRVIRFDSPIGPRVVKDPGKFEYHEGSIVWVVSR